MTTNWRRLLAVCALLLAVVAAFGSASAASVSTSAQLEPAGTICRGSGCSAQTPSSIQEPEYKDSDDVPMKPKVGSLPSGSPTKKKTIPEGTQITFQGPPPAFGDSHWNAMTDAERKLGKCFLFYYLQRLIIFISYSTFVFLSRTLSRGGYNGI